MIKARLDKENGILHIRPSGPLEEADFDQLSGLADPYIAKKGKLAGVMVEIEKFPGWKNLTGMLQHFRFVRGHHRKIRRVALVTDARIGRVAEKVARHFLAAEVKRFAADQGRQARKWLTDG
jgi:hypothetical protein